MSGKPSPDQRERLEHRLEFVRLTGFNSIDVMRRGDPLPALTLTIEGLPGDERLAELVLDVLEYQLPKLVSVTGTKRALVDVGELSLKKRRTS